MYRYQLLEEYYQRDLSVGLEMFFLSMLSDKIVLYPTMAAEHLKCWCDSETEFFIEINVNSPR